LSAYETEIQGRQWGETGYIIGQVTCLHN